VLIREFILS